MFKKNKNKQQGFSLLEILISVAILSVGLLGFAQAQLIALQHTQAAYLTSVAQVQLLSLAESIRSCNLFHCTYSDFSQAFSNWNTLNTYLLPAGQGLLSEQTMQQVVQLQWQVAKENAASKEQATLMVPV